MARLGRAGSPVRAALITAVLVDIGVLGVDVYLRSVDAATVRVADVGDGRAVPSPAEATPSLPAAP